MININTKKIDELKVLVAHGYIQKMKKFMPYENIHDAEFQVFSQFGDDGIIQYLIHALNINETSFVEFGVENYTEANTRFLLVHDNWRGLIIDGSSENIETVKQDDISWRHDLTAVCSFVAKDNINSIIGDAGFSGEIGLLSIDIDGNDYWIWECINICNPIIVIAEYNSLFGSKHAITIPYEPNFNRTNAHYSNQYWGCSLRALTILAEKKGYAFIGSNSNGCNAYFIRKDRLGFMHPVTVEEGYVESRFRDSRDKNGRLTFISGAARLGLIEDMPVIDITNGEVCKIKDLMK